MRPLQGILTALITPFDGDSVDVPALRRLVRAQVAAGIHGLVACGTTLGTCLSAAEELRRQEIDAGVINARFVKPLDADTILRAVAEVPVVVTVEEGALAGGFGSAVLEAANEAGLDARRVRRLGIADRFIEHGDRKELLADLGLDEAGVLQTCLSLIAPRSRPSVARVQRAR